MSRKKIVITGGEGFIGTNLIKKLSIINKFDLISIDNNQNSSKNLYEIKNLCKIEREDIKNKQKINEILTGVDLVIHLAASGNVIESVSNPINNFNNNVQATINLIEGMREVSVNNIIFASTGGALMGNGAPPVNENSLPKPISPYGASKLACEGYLNAYSNSFGFNSIILRFGNVYGKYSSHKKGVINKWLNSAMNNTPLVIFGDGNFSRDYVYVDDICDGIISSVMLLLFHESTKEISNSRIFHLANNKEVKLIDLAELIKKILKSKSQIIFKEGRLGEVGRNFASYKKASEELKFFPKINLESGLETTARWFYENN